MKKIVLLSMAFLIATSAFAGDVLTLNNKLVFEGKVKRIKNCTVIFKAKGKRFSIPTSDIYSIEFQDTDDKVYTNYVKLLKKDDNNNCLKARFDAENYHGKNGGHFFLGFLFGPFAIIGTALSNPTPEKGKRTYMLSKNKEEFSDLEYLSCYKKKAKGKLIGMEAIGWLSSILITLLIQK